MKFIVFRGIGLTLLIIFGFLACSKQKRIIGTWAYGKTISFPTNMGALSVIESQTLIFMKNGGFECKIECNGNSERYLPCGRKKFNDYGR